MTREEAEHRTDACLLLGRHTGSTGALWLCNLNLTDRRVQKPYSLKTHTETEQPYITLSKNKIAYRTQEQQCHQQMQGRGNEGADRVGDNA